MYIMDNYRFPRYDDKVRRVHKVPLSKKLKITGLIITVVFVLSNVITWVIYLNKTYPNTTLAKVSIGNVNYDVLQGKAQSLNILSKHMNLEALELHRVKYLASQLGMTADYTHLLEQRDAGRSWLPIANFFVKHEMFIPLRVDDKIYAAGLVGLEKSFDRQPVDAQISLDTKTFWTKDEHPGYTLNSAPLRRIVEKSISHGNFNIGVPVNIRPAKVTSRSLDDTKNGLLKQLNAVITYTSGGRTYKVSKNDFIPWYKKSGSTYVLSDELVQNNVRYAGKMLGIRSGNVPATAAIVKAAITKGETKSIALQNVPYLKKYTYCTSVRNVDQSNLTALQSKLKSTYSDNRGWNLMGDVDFAYVDSGCDYTVWLSSAEAMPSFGGVCDSDWSCRIGNNVVINFDRWQHASDAWNASKGSLDDYRSMVINHETGHWLGFGHSSCSSPNSPAPVMQQQSIDLKGCKFNPWPLAEEADQLRSKLGG